MLIPSPTLASITQPVSRPPRPATPAVPLPDTSKPASRLLVMVQPETISPSAPQSEMPNRLAWLWQPMIRKPRGGVQ